MFEIKCITFALWIHALCNVMADNIVSKLELSPLHPVIHVGEELNVTCIARFCQGNATIQWKEGLDNFHGGEVKHQHINSYMRIRNISVRNDMSLICHATCGGAPREKTTKINVYSFPQDPVVDQIKSLRANQTQTLNCTLYNIYPLEKLEIEWFFGDKRQIVQPEESYDHAKNFSSEIRYTPSVNDLGKNITCKATLTLGNNFSKTRSSTAEYGPGNMIISNNTTINLGEHLELTCQADGNPKPTIQWWKLEETGAVVQTQNHKLIINKASCSQAGSYRCNASNIVGSMQMMVNVTVLGAPSAPKLQLSPDGEPEEGQNVTILCSSEGRTANLSLYRLSHNNVTERLNESTALLHIASIKKTDEGVYVCEAKNDCGLEKSSIELTVKAKPIPSKMPDLPVAVLPAVGSLSLLTIAGLLIRFLRKKFKTDSSVLN